jgi:hypothetical protein
MDPAPTPSDSPVDGPLPASRHQWHAFAQEAARDLERRLRRYSHLSALERSRLGRRLGAVIDRALDVPPDLPARIARSTDAVRSRRPGADPVDLAWSRTRTRARRTAAIGAVTTMPAMLPGLGTALAALGLVADWRFVAEQQRDLVLEIAALLGVPLKDPTRQIRSLYLASAASAFGASAAGDAVARALAAQVARRSVTRIVPGAGALVAGALNYIATVTLGRLAIARFAADAGVAVEGVVPQRVHPAMPWLRNAVLDAIEARAEPRPRSVFSAEDRATIRTLSRAEREELLDLAVVGVTALGEGVGDEEEALIEEVAEALDFGRGSVLAARRAAAREARTIGVRVRRLIARARRSGGAATGTLWRMAARLARGRPFRRRRPPPPSQAQ